MNRYFSAFALVILLLSACQPGTKKIPVTFQSHKIGWAITIPDGYSIMSDDKINDMNAKGKAAIENVYDSAITIDSLINLLTFSKDAFNMLGSTIEPFREEYPGEYAENNKGIQQLIYETYKSQGIKADSSSGMETIAGVKFHVFYTTIYAPDGKVILNQILYSTLRKGYDFGVHINYNKPEEKEILLKAFRNSKFTP